MTARTPEEIEPMAWIYENNGEQRVWSEADYHRMGARFPEECFTKVYSIGQLREAEQRGWKAGMEKADELWMEWKIKSKCRCAIKTPFILKFWAAEEKGER